MDLIVLILITAAVFILQSILFKKRTFINLNYKCRFSRSEAYEGDELQFVETVENCKRLPVPWLKVSIHSSRWLDFADSFSRVTQEGRYATSSFFLKGFQKVTRRWRLKCLKRGVYEIENVTFLGSDLIGFSTTSIAVPVNETIKVYPSLIDLEEYFIPVNFIQGNTIVKRWIVDDPFLVAGAREYTPRDSMNKVNWSATARTGHIMVKKNDFTSQLSLCLILNIQSFENEYSDFGDKNKVEFGIKAAASILDRATRMGMPARLMVNGSDSKAGNMTTITKEEGGTEHFFDLMEVLAKLKLKAAKDFELFLGEIGDQIENSHVYVITAYITDAVIENIRKLSAASNRITLMLLDETVKAAVPEDIEVYKLN